MTDTRTICELDGSGFWTGQAHDIGPLDGRPPAWLETASPPNDTAVPAGQGWAWLGAWVLTDLPVAPAPYVPTFSDLQSTKSAQVDTQRDTILAGGFTHDFGGAVGVKTLQTRDPVDITNWLTSQAAYSAAVMGGHGSVVAAAFRATDNTTFTLSYQDGLSALLAMAAHGAALYANAWALKDSIAATKDQASLDAIDVTSSWAAIP